MDTAFNKQARQFLRIAFAALLLAGTFVAAAQGAPPLINYQGRVIVGTTNFEGTGHFKFALVNANGTTSFWSNAGGGAGPATEPATAVQLTVTKGLYSLLLGDTTIANMAAIPASAFTNPDVRLRVWFSDGTPTGFQLLTPDQRLAPTAYLADGVVQSANIADAAIVSSKVAPGAITGAQIATGALDATRFATPGAPAPGQVLGYNASGLTWTAPGGGVFSLNGTNAYYSGGNVGIGTSSPAAKLDVRGSLVLEAGSSPSIFTGTGASELNRYLTILNSPNAASASGLKAGGVLVADSYNFANPGKSDLIVQGNMGLGTATLNNTTRLTIETAPGAFAVSKWGIEQTDGTVRLATYVGNGGYRTGLGTRSNHPLSFFVNDGEPSLTVSTTGRIGLGTDSPAHRLAIVGGTPWTSEQWAGAIELQNGAAIGWQANAAGQRFGIGHSTSGFGVFRTASNPGTIGSAPIYDLFINDSGSIGIGTAGPASTLDVVGDISGTRLVLRADPAAPTNAAVLCANAGVVNFVPYNTALNRPLNLIVRDATVRTLTITGGADLAEPFSTEEGELEKGSVVVIDDQHPGRLKRSSNAYDTRAAGIISGANGVNPGIALHQEGVMEGGQNVALSGRVYVQADATDAPIKPGDLLTTSDIPGHAMKVTDHAKAQGAVIGKAMSSLDEGTGMVLVLVTLQ